MLCKESIIGLDRVQHCTVTLLKICYNTMFFVSEIKFRGRGQGIKFLKKVERNGSKKKVGMKGTFLL